MPLRSDAVRLASFFGSQFDYALATPRKRYYLEREGHRLRLGASIKRMRISIVGTGYVGLVTGACLAEVGNDVLCLDLDPEKIRMLNQGGIPIFERGLPELVARNMAAGRLRFTTNVEASVEHGVIQFIAVGTPPDEDGSADLKYVLAAARDIGRYMNEYKVIVDKSTVPVGTAEMVGAAVHEQLVMRGRGTAGSLQFSMVSNPEFLKEGAAIDDFMRPDRIVIGANDERAIQLMRSLYAPFQRNHERFIVMDVRSAELTKYAANAMLATRVSFMNELANLAEKLGADIDLVRRGIGSDARIGYHFLYPGCGYGGSCFPKDVKALINTASGYDEELQILRAVEAVNNTQKRLLGRKIRTCFGSDLSGLHFALWGLSFKPNTDDMREAPSRALIADLLDSGATITAYDPAAVGEARRIFEGEERMDYANSPIAALENADALVIVTEWKEFHSPDFEKIKEKLRTPHIFDGRNLFDPQIVASYGLAYHGIGRKGILP
jgi:UDPglucose 6-dehydrogenase